MDLRNREPSHMGPVRERGRMCKNSERSPWYALDTQSYIFVAAHYFGIIQIQSRQKDWARQLVVLASNRNHGEFQKRIWLLIRGGTSIYKQVNASHRGVGDCESSVAIGKCRKIRSPNAGGYVDKRFVGVVQHDPAHGSICHGPGSDSRCDKGCR